MTPSNEPVNSKETRRGNFLKGLAVVAGSIAIGSGFAYFDQTGRVPFVHYETEQEDQQPCVTVDSLAPDTSVPSDEVAASLMLADMVNIENC